MGERKTVVLVVFGKKAISPEDAAKLELRLAASGVNAVVFRDEAEHDIPCVFNLEGEK